MEVWLLEKVKTAGDDALASERYLVDIYETEEAAFDAARKSIEYSITKDVFAGMGRNAGGTIEVATAKYIISYRKVKGKGQ